MQSFVKAHTYKYTQKHTHTYIYILSCQNALTDIFMLTHNFGKSHAHTPIIIYLALLLAPPLYPPTPIQRKQIVHESEENVRNWSKMDIITTNNVK